MIKPGFRSSEFKLALILNIAPLLLAYLGKLDAQWAVAVAGIVSAGYAWARSHVKAAAGGDVKPGFRSTEFALVAFINIAPLLLALLGKLDAQWAVAIAGIVDVLYGLARSHVKASVSAEEATLLNPEDLLDEIESEDA